MSAGLGPWLRGVCDAYDIPPKEVAARSRVHESTLSRFFNGIKDIDARQFGRVCIAVGEAKSEKLGKVGRA